LKLLSNNMNLSFRVRFMLKDVIDLRRNRWQVRRKVDEKVPKGFITAMKSWGSDPTKKVTFFMMEVEEKVLLASRNIGTLKILTPRTLNLYDVLNADKIVFTPGAVDYLNGRYGDIE
jgi:ribosomal protein L4